MSCNKYSPFRHFIQNRTLADDLQLYDSVKNQLFKSFKTFKNTYDNTLKLPLNERTRIGF